MSEDRDKNRTDGAALKEFLEAPAVDFPLDEVPGVGITLDSDYDDAYKQVWKATRASIFAAKALIEANIEGGGAEEGVAVYVPEYAHTIIGAAELGNEILKRAEENPELKYDLSGLSPQLLREARADLVYVVHHLGIEVSLPSPQEAT